jgi:hypothetical protein
VLRKKLVLDGEEFTVIGVIPRLSDRYIAPQRLSAVLLSILAGIALLLAAVGTYGVMAYMVGGTHAGDIGVPRALPTAHDPPNERVGQTQKPAKMNEPIWILPI